MIKRTAEQIARLAGGNLVQGEGALLVHGIATDTRKDMTGRLFVPIVGERFDGHDFIEAAVDQGATAALWQAGTPVPAKAQGLALIEVADTLVGLQRLAAGYRNELQNLRVIGVTGSNGKTSTKDLLASVLSERFKVQQTLGNLNNHIGVPLMLLHLEEGTEVAVLEMGMNHRHEIALLAELAAPLIGVITNIGEAHIEYLGSRGGIADAKCELIEALPPSGKAILFGDEPLLRERAGLTQAPVVWFGFGEGNDIRAVEVENLGIEGSRFQLAGEKGTYTLPVPGLHQLGNALAAVAVGEELGMTREEIKRGLAQAKLTARRFEVHQASFAWLVEPIAATSPQGTVIDDAYNASPTSMRAALAMLDEMPGGYKVAALGGMLELGPDSVLMHRETGAYLASLQIAELVCIGDLALDIAVGAREGGFGGLIHEVVDKPQAIEYLENVLTHHAQDETGGAIVLVKSSLGIGLVDVVRALT
ncbi:UDP-N-acetylmuramoyl-tripeptide--D-alanyl-D-alanine ligase [Tumebacillus permanentifrigoris]|uniref:UDP-N-acetylmuramoyl-tripeptide--D-alanyl-D-alanine ligase n=1 Tax=Tumebacillus permanentifrigoris TaxID=378543 RepID=A0A316D8U4_9BACL|nr:UDP-N-acetylmuramoyl-tripeptide--D-alanyl-D-alanine ligase [Tumebacillus permanentifrigoris]PWK11629.1 UDP-N-acetylmuramoyl-tripeptide--D-alanyl-D-alanine ligase [Tumebacillus permanentifrigoris]